MQTECPVHDGPITSDPFGEGIVECAACGCRYHARCALMFTARGCAQCGVRPFVTQSGVAVDGRHRAEAPVRVRVRRRQRRAADIPITIRRRHAPTEPTGFAVLCGWLVGGSFYLAIGLLLVRLAPMLPNNLIGRLLLFLGAAWQLCNGVCFGIITTGALSGEQQRIIIARRVLLASTILTGLIAIPFLEAYRQSVASASMHVIIPSQFQNSNITTQLLNAGYPSKCSSEYRGSGFSDVVMISNGQWDNGQVEADQRAYFDVYENKITFGYLTGDGHWDAVVHTACGVEASTEAYSEVFVVDTSSARLKVLARLSPRDWGDDALGITWNASNTSVKNGALRISYLLGGSHAQPAWNATAVFRWNGTAFVRTDLIRTPFQPLSESGNASQQNPPLTTVPTPNSEPGAAQSTAAAGESPAAMGFVRVVSQPDSQVAVDGIASGTTNAAGVFLDKLPVGSHQVTVSKDSYQQENDSVEILPRQIAELRASLTPLEGFLSVTSNMPNALIAVSGLGNFMGSVSHVSCPAGLYSIQVSRTGMQTITRTVSVSVGQSASVQINLVPDPIYIRTIMMMARTAASRGDAIDASRDAATILSLDDTNGPAWGILASADSSLGNWNQFGNDAREAIVHGATIVFMMMHEHNHYGFTGESIHPIQITLTPTTLEIDSLGRGDDAGHIVSPLATIGTIEVTDKSVVGGKHFIGAQIRALMPGTYLLHLDVQRGGSAKDRMQLYLATPDAQIVRGEYGVKYLAEPSSSLNALKIVAKIIGMAVARNKVQAQEPHPASDSGM